MKLKFVFIVFLLALITSVMTQELKATEIDTLWMKDLWRGHEEEIIKTMVSSDDSLIFVGYKKPAKIDVYNAVNGDSIRTLTFPRSASVLDDYDISQNGKYIVAFENEDTTNIFQVWDMKTGNHLRTILEHDTNYTSFKLCYFIRFTPDSRYIFTSLGGKKFQDYKGNWHDSIPRFLVIDTINWQVQREIGIARNYYYSPYDKFEISPDNKFYASPYYQLNEMPRIEFRDINNDTLISTFEDNTNTIYGYTDLKFSPDSNYFMCHGGNYWYIWQIGQQNYYRKYEWNELTKHLPIGFTTISGVLTQIKVDTISKIWYASMLDFINNTILCEFKADAYELHFLKSNERFLLRNWYTLVMIDTSWIFSSVENNGNPSTIINILPNPAKNEILIKVKNEEMDVYGIRVFNNNGYLSFENENNSDSKLIENDTFLYRIDTSQMQNGTYFIELKSASGKVMFDKFIINR